MSISTRSLSFKAKQDPPSGFQQAKKEYQATAKVPPGYEAEDLDRGFVVTGLFSWSRPPNFAAEQGKPFSPTFHGHQRH